MPRRRWWGSWCVFALLLGGCVSLERSLVIGTSTHPYVFAFSPSRHILEWPAGWWRIFYFDGTSVMTATVHQGRRVGPPRRVSHIPVAPGFSITLDHEVLYLTYSDGSDITAYLRTATLHDQTLTFTPARPIHTGTTPFSVQAASVAMAPDGRLTVVYRSIVGSPNRMPLYVIQATDRFGTAWGAPVEVTTPMQRNGSGAGTSGMAFWPGGHLTVILATDALYANTRTPDGWEVHCIDPDYRGTHDFNGAMVSETLYVAYRTERFIRWITYHPVTGWSKPHNVLGAQQHSIALGLTPRGTPMVFGLDGTSRFWRSVGTSGETVTLQGIGPRQVRSSWLAVPQQFHSALAFGWVDGLAVPYQVRFWVGPSFEKGKDEHRR